MLHKEKGAPNHETRPLQTYLQLNGIMDLTRRATRRVWTPEELFERDLNNFHPLDRMRLEEFGIDPAIDRRLPVPGIGKMHASIQRNGLYHPCACGVELFTVAVPDGPRILDIVGFMPGVRGKFWLRYGVATYLGDPKTDRITSDPTAWLQDDLKSRLCLIIEGLNDDD